MSLMIKTFWIFLLFLSVLGVVALGMVGIPAKSAIVVKSIPPDRLPQ